MPRRLRDIVVILAVVSLFGATLLHLFAGLSTVLYLPEYVHTLFVFADIVLMLYFGYVGFKRHSKPIWLLALLQLLLYVVVLATNSHAVEDEIISDSLSSFMYLIINGVGGVIIIYALRYIESEDASRLKRNGFIALLLGFLGVMNFIVSTNNIETFFLLYELTTLCSFLLIGFRGDDLSFANASRALWMNQIGGVAILLALIGAITTYETVYFNVLLEKADALILAPIVLEFLRDIAEDDDRTAVGNRGDGRHDRKKRTVFVYEIVLNFSALSIVKG
ncbi:MAG: hypothetical protein IE916_11305 [Epsilonproteobacteria bacterium]|nr:hypothetical protein [Campylobacterota bacterium]